MEVEKVKYGDCLLVRVRGELDHHWAEKLRQAIDFELGGGLRHLVLNLEGLSFMDSSGVGVLLGRYKRLKERGGRMALAGVPSTVRKVLHLSGIPRVIPSCDSEAEALRQVARGWPAQRRSG